MATCCTEAQELGRPRLIQSGPVCPARRYPRRQIEEAVIQCVDELEELGDQAKAACEKNGGNVDQQLKQAVMQAHEELRNLKHQLH